MLAKVAILFAMALAAIGLGTPLLRLVAPTRFAGQPFPLGLAGLFGLVAAALVAIVVNFFIPVVPTVSYGLLAIGLLLFLTVATRPDRWSWIALAGVCILAGPLAVWSHEGYDGGLYHLPVQLWMVVEKAVFGLANVHGRFGMNSLNEGLLALGWVNENDLAVAQLVSGLFGLFFLLALIDAMRAAAREPALLLMATIAAAATLWIQIFVVVAIGWTGTDQPTAIVIILCFYYGFAALLREDRDDLALSFFFAAAAIAMKTSGAVVALLPIAVVALLARRIGWRAFPAGAVVLTAAIFLPWLARSFVLTGCVAFPLASSCLPVAWESSAEAASITEWAIAWARVPQTGLDYLTGWAWLPIWFGLRAKFLAAWLALGALGTVGALLLRRWMPGRPVPTVAALALTACALIGVAAWFLSAPDPRFGIGQLAVAAMLPGIWILTVPRKPQPEAAVPLWIPVGILALAVAGSVAYGWQRGFGDRAWLAYRPAYFGAVPTTVVTGDVIRPVKGDQCYLSQPPCTPYTAGAEGRIGGYRVFYALP